MGKFEHRYYSLEVRLYGVFGLKSRPFGLHPLLMHVIGNHNL